MDEHEQAAAEALADPRTTGEKIRELVEAEETAMAAETPTDEDEEGAEDEDEMAQRAILEAYSEYISRVQGALGSDVEVKPCIFCHGFGFNPTQVLPDPHSHRCEMCGGIGQVATGSLVAGNESRMCDGCRGTGFVVVTPTIPIAETADLPEPFQVLSPAEVEKIAAEARARAGVNAT